MSARRLSRSTRRLSRSATSTPIPAGFEFITSPMPGHAAALAASSQVDLTAGALSAGWASTSAGDSRSGSPRMLAAKNFGAVIPAGEMDWEDIIEDRRRKEGGIGVGVRIGEEEAEGDGLDLGSFLDEMDKAAGGDGISWRESLNNRHTCAFPPVLHISALPGLPARSAGPFQTTARPKSTFNTRSRQSPRSSVHGSIGGGHSRRGSQTFVVGSLAGPGANPSPISASVRRRSLVGSLPAPPRRASVATGAPAMPSTSTHDLPQAIPLEKVPTAGGRRRSSVVKTIVPPRSFSVDASTFIARRRMSSVSGASSGKLSKRQTQFQKDAAPSFAVQTPLTEALALRRASAPGVMPRRPARPASLNLFDGDKPYNPGSPQPTRTFDTNLLQETTIRARRISISAVKFDKQFRPVAEPKLQAKGAGDGHLAQRDAKENFEFGSPVMPVTRAGSFAVGMQRSLTAGAIAPPRSFSLSAGPIAGLNMGRSTSSIGPPSAPFSLDAYPAFNAAALRGFGGGAGTIDPFSFPLPPGMSKPSTPEPGSAMARRPSVVPRIPVPAYAVLAAELGLEEDRPSSPSKIRAPGSGVGAPVRKAAGAGVAVEARKKLVLPELPKFEVEVMGFAT